MRRGVWSVECAEFEVLSVEGGVGSGERVLGNVKCVECGVRSVECRV